MYGGGDELFATDPKTGDIYRYNRTPLYWTKIGGPGKMFAVDSYGELYGIAPDGKSVWQYDGKPMKWTKIGGSAGHIYAGGKNLFVTNPQTGNIYKYDKKKSSWPKVGGPGKMFAVDDYGHLFAISPDGTSVWQYDNNPKNPMHWTKIGGAASKICAGKHLYLIKSQTGEVYQYDGKPNSWTKLGFAASDIYARGVDLFANSSQTGYIYRYDHTPNAWSKIGGSGKMFAVGFEPGFPQFGEGTAWGKGTASLILEVEPGHPNQVYLGYADLANGPRYFAQVPKGTFIPETDGYQCNTYAPLSEKNQKRLEKKTLFLQANEASLWLGDFSGFQEGNPSTQKASWTQMPGPPDYYGVSTPSGRVYVKVHPTSGGYLLFFGDRCHLHMTAGRPKLNGWHRLDGYGVSTTWKAWKNIGGKKNKLENRLIMHVDPHALVVSPDFNVSLKAPSGVPFMYAKNQELDKYFEGRIWVANDGGVYESSNGGKTWNLAYSGPNTLLVVNLAGVVIKGKAPALYMGVGDNDDFFTMDGGKKWVTQFGGCGDCGHWFADPAHPSRVVELGAAGRRGPYIFVYTDAAGGYPNLEKDDKHQMRMIPHPDEAIYNVNNGSRILVLTLPSEPSASHDDYIVIQKKNDGSRILVRAKNSQNLPNMSGWKYSEVENYWKKHTIWKQVGPKLPTYSHLVQASGGHNSPVFFVGDGKKLWKSQRDSKGKLDRWDQIVPAKGVSETRRFFVNPYDPKNIYILDYNGIKSWNEKKKEWVIDKSLNNLATGNGEFHYNASTSNCVLNDLIFYRDDSKQRFAVGTVGVFYTLDGTNWHRILDTNALPCRPRSLFFDHHARALYVASEGRGVLKIHPIPKP